MLASDLDAGTVGGPESAGEWRSALRAFLTERLNYPPASFGEIIDCFAPSVPRYEVERFWHEHHPNDDGVVGVNRKMADLLHHELTRYRLMVTAPVGAKGKSWTREHTVQGIGQTCPACHRVFLSVRSKTETCSVKCGRLMFEARKPAGEPQAAKPRRTTIMPAGRHPEITAMETVFETLRRLPNQAARERVMVHVTQMLEDVVEEAEVAPVTGNGRAEDDFVPVAH
jgi:hypothetical protein